MRRTKFENDLKMPKEISHNTGLLHRKADDAKILTREGRTPQDAGRTIDCGDYRPHDRRRMHADHGRSRQSYEDRYTALNTDRAEILHHISKSDMSNKLKWPSPIRHSAADRCKYCAFHKDYGHDTNECFNLRKAIEDLIKRGYLRDYVHTGHDDKTNPPPESSQLPPIKGIINTIIGSVEG